ncbi:MAG TPA: lysophospholipid acyltransferase family protein [Myxococcales bacterium]|nr:lysophospholipid acyltransferase family protein [Myxococcales bacterium]
MAMIAMVLTLNPGSSIWWARTVWAPVLLWSGNARLEVHGREHVNARRPTLYISNHQSTADIPVLFMAIPVNLRFVAKKQLAWVPLLGWYMVAAGYIFVDRGNRSKAIASLERAARKIRRGISLIMYAEGTRSEDGRILPFKKGPFALALKAGVAVCPVTIEGTARVMPKNRWTITPGTIKVKIGAPIDTSTYGPDERERLIHDVRQVIIRQSLELGGPGGDTEADIAEPGLEGLGRPLRSPPSNAA